MPITPPSQCLARREHIHSDFRSISKRNSKWDHSEWVVGLSDPSCGYQILESVEWFRINFRSVLMAHDPRSMNTRPWQAVHNIISAKLNIESVLKTTILSTNNLDTRMRRKDIMVVRMLHSRECSPNALEMSSSWSYKSILPSARHFK